MLNSLANDPNEDPISPHVPIMPFKKMHTTKVKHHRPKFERGRRACSEPPTARTELANLADGNIDNTNEAANDELDKLEAKLTSPGENQDQVDDLIPKVATVITKHKSLNMCRNDSIGPLQSTIGMKRTRQQEDEEDGDEFEEHGEKDLKKLWVNKRARLTTREDQDSQKINTNIKNDQKDDSKAID